MANRSAGSGAKAQESSGEPSFEEALTQLEDLVSRLEEGGLPLSEAVDHYERGMSLAAYCAGQLDNAELRIRQIDAATYTGAGIEDEYNPDAPDETYDVEYEINRLLFEEE